MGTQEILIVFVIVYFLGWVMGTWVLIVFSMIKDCLKKEKGETNKWNLQIKINDYIRKTQYRK